MQLNKRKYAKALLNLFKVNILSRTSLYFKLFVVMFAVFAITTMLIAYQLEQYIETSHFDAVKEELMSIATSTALHVNGDEVQLLQQREQEDSLPYKNLQQFLLTVMYGNPKINDMYIVRKGSRDQEVVFVVDASESETEHASLGEIYDASMAPDMLRGFSEPAVDNNFTSDKWGQTLSGYAPVRNSQKKVVGVLGVDFDASSIQQELAAQREKILYYSIMGMLVMLLISFAVGRTLVKRLENIKHVLDMLLEENLDVAVYDTGRDEIKALALRVNRLTKKLSADREQMFMVSIANLVNALEAKDEYTHGHSAEVANIVVDIMQAMKLEPDEQFAIHFAAILHDIGKIGIPDAILHKNDKLTEEEFLAIREHPVIGAKILSGNPALEEIQHLVKHHHERYDGRGYPAGLSGENILLGARIIAIADSFQAMISDRPYRRGMSQQEAMEEMARNKGTQFDPALVELFLAICQKKCYKT